MWESKIKRRLNGIEGDLSQAYFLWDKKELSEWLHSKAKYRITDPGIQRRTSRHWTRRMVLKKRINNVLFLFMFSWIIFFGIIFTSSTTLQKSWVMCLHFTPSCNIPLQSLTVFDAGLCLDLNHFHDSFPVLKVKMSRNVSFVKDLLPFFPLFIFSLYF